MLNRRSFLKVVLGFLGTEVTQRVFHLPDTKKPPNPPKPPQASPTEKTYQVPVTLGMGGTYLFLVAVADIRAGDIVKVSDIFVDNPKKADIAIGRVLQDASQLGEVTIVIEPQ